MIIGVRKLPNNVLNKIIIKDTNKIFLYLENKNLISILLDLNKLLIKLIEKTNAYILKKAKINELIISNGNIYAKPINIPLKPKFNTIALTEKPKINDIDIKIRKIRGIPIIDIPRTQITRVYNKLEDMLDFKVSR